ncbi:MAG: cyclic nucleotide-binding domain-containing protein [Proteobacteria bacterium]|nr:cyclic nucleotide-binding domain-containing protein [Pseudomonadota bacterium]
MPFTEFVSYVDLIGYLGGTVTLWGLFQKTMIPLRVGAVIGNVGFMAFGLMVPSYPTLILHALLLPLNAYRMMQMIRLIREIRESAGQSNSLDPLIPYMKQEREPAGTVLFRIDDAPDRMIVIKSGTIRLEEIDVRCGAGDVLGEIAAFTPDNRRTCTAVCDTDCELFTLSNDAMIQLFHQNPRFGMFLTRVIVQRLLKNWQDADARAHALLT